MFLTSVTNAVPSGAVDEEASCSKVVRASRAALPSASRFLVPKPLNDRPSGSETVHWTGVSVWYSARSAPSKRSSNSRSERPMSEPERR